MSFVHLHTHSSYSLLESSATVEQLVDRAISQGSPAIALTDEHNCSGLFEFNELCQKKKIKPILGIQISVVRDMTNMEEEDVSKYIILLAKNKIGWRNLCVLSSEAYLTGFCRTPRIDYNLLQKHAEGLILLTGGMEGHLANRILYNKLDDAKFLLNFYKKLFGEDVYVELGFHPSPAKPANETFQKRVLEVSMKMAEEVGIKCVCTNDVHYCDNDMQHILAQDTLSCIKQHKTIKDERRRLPSNEYYMKTREEMEKLFPNRQDVLDNTLEIASKVESCIIDKGQDLLPKFQAPEGYTSASYLRFLVEEGLKKKNLFDKKEYRDRADWELRVFDTCGFVNYFLVLYEFVNWAKNSNISMGPGRGCFLPENKVVCKDGKKNITEVRKGDAVLAYDGKYHEVINTMSYDVNEEIIEINMEDGRKIECTLDHKIHVKRGAELIWIMAKDLTDGDVLYDIDSKNPCSSCAGEGWVFTHADLTRVDQQRCSRCNGWGVYIADMKLVKIKSFSRRIYKGKVHDITVRGVHAYNIDGLSVHNSAVGSLALYCLDITKLDPIKYGLLFERFFSVDTKYVIKPKMFGFNFDVPDVEINKPLITKIYEMAKKHPEFNEQRFVAEAKKMKVTKCFDEFMKIFSAFVHFSTNAENGQITESANDCNSVMAYYSGMTSIRPNGAFEPQEELVAARVSPPDVDLDFDPKNRDKIFEHLRDVYGTARVAQIGTANCFKGKMSIRDIGKALDIGGDWEEIQKIKKEKEDAKIRGEKMEESVRPRRTLEEVDRIASFAETGLSFKEAYESSADLRYVFEKQIVDDNKTYYKICCQFDGLVRHFGVHAAGGIICNRDLKEVLPLRFAEIKNSSKHSDEVDEDSEDGSKTLKTRRIVCSQWSKDQVEAIGLYKYDLLALENITITKKTMELLKEEGIEFDLDAIEPNDPKVLQMISEGKTAGMFQFETRGQTELVKLIGVDSFNDMVAINAINRPGPIKAGVGDKYSARKRKEEEVEYPHPSMVDVLKDTYGLIIYQEQIMNLSRSMAGFSRSEADKLRKAIGKKKVDVLDAMREKFIDGCLANGIEKATAIDVWQMIYNFGEYGFNMCLNGDTKVFNKKDSKFYSLRDLEEKIPDCGVFLESYIDGEIVDDELLKVFSTGEKEVYEIELENGETFKCTLNHKFYCSDGNKYTVSDILESDMEIVHYGSGKDKLKIKLAKLIGTEKTYNVTMKSEQHNYAVYLNEKSFVITANSHSLAYAYLAYQEAYLKYYYPLHFFCALMTSIIGKDDKFAAYKLEAAGDERLGIKGLGVKFWPVHINKSKAEYFIDNKGLRLPFTIVDGVGEASVNALVLGQPYDNFEDFVQKVDGRSVNTTVVRNLARVKYGAFAPFGISEKDAVEKFELMKKDLSRRKMNKSRFVNENVFSKISMMPDRKN